MVRKLAQALLTIVYIPAVMYCLYLNVGLSGTPEEKDVIGAVTQIPLAFLALLGAGFGFYVSHRWGWLKSLVGKTMFFFSLGTASWGGGMLVWLVYIFILSTATVPYPSLADYIFMWSQPFWMVGAFHLAQVIGVQFGLRNKKGKVIMLIAPIVSIAVSYYLLFKVARGGYFSLEGQPLQMFFDFYYPMGTVISLSLISIIFVLSRSFLGGKYRAAVYVLLLGYAAQYLGDFLYTLANNNGTYFNGHWSDLMFMTAMYLISVGVVSISPEA